MGFCHVMTWDDTDADKVLLLSLIFLFTCRWQLAFWTRLCDNFAVSLLLRSWPVPHISRRTGRENSRKLDEIIGTSVGQSIG